MDDLHNRVLQESRGYYFESYSDLAGHEIMIRDYSRTFSYKQAIEMNSHLFEGKIVLDVGCGLGILSLFAARAGAKTVIGIDASDITVYAEKIVEANHASNVIIKQAKIEDLEELPLGIEKVDIIISEWMGYCLYHESMLTTVIHARDKWLKKDGLIFPDKVKLYLAAIDDQSTIDRIEHWNTMGGCNMKELKKTLYKEASLIAVESHKVVTDYCLLHQLDLNTASSDFSFRKNYQLIAQRDANVVGFVVYFDAIFSKCHKKIILSTSPDAPLTHWRQTVFPFRDSMWVVKDTRITGEFILNPFQYNFRDLYFRISRNTTSSNEVYHITSDYILR